MFASFGSQNAASDGGSWHGLCCLSHLGHSSGAKVHDQDMLSEEMMFNFKRSKFIFTWWLNRFNKVVSQHNIFKLICWLPLLSDFLKTSQEVVKEWSWSFTNNIDMQVFTNIVIEYLICQLVTSIKDSTLGDKDWVNKVQFTRRHLIEHLFAHASVIISQCNDRLHIHNDGLCSLDSRSRIDKFLSQGVKIFIACWKWWRTWCSS